MEIKKLLELQCQVITICKLYRYNPIILLKQNNFPVYAFENSHSQEVKITTPRENTY